MKDLIPFCEKSATSKQVLELNRLGQQVIHHCLFVAMSKRLPYKKDNATTF